MNVTRCAVYKSLRRAETYLYVPDGKALAALPDALAASLGTLEFVMQLELTPGRKLARADAARVIDALACSGYYVQFPPPPAVTDR
jgi:uncharacterized protein YcgL (UPF0745 family)